MRQARADLHVHSKYSDRPSEWLLRRIGSPESFTEPMDVYHKCLQRGMDFVTLSDHNRLDGALAIAHLPNTFLSVEVTTYFPENGGKMHILATGITEAQFAMIQKLRQNIYEFRRYVVENDIIVSVAHPLFRVNDKVGPDEIEKLLVLFNRFEGINGTRDPRASEMVNAIFRNLTPDLIQRMADRHGIEPIGDEPWKKTFTAGSDDHGGIYIASAYTTTPPARTVEAYLQHLRQGNHEQGGVSGDSVKLAHSFYHIAWAYYRARILNTQGKSSLVGELFRRLLERPAPTPVTLGQRFKQSIRKIVTNHRKKKMTDIERDLVEQFGQLLRNVQSSEHPDQNHPPTLSDGQTFDLACKITHQLSSHFFRNFVQNARNGNLLETLQTVASLGPVAIGISPYIAAMATQHKDERFMQEVAQRFDAAGHLRHRSDRRAWLTDTFADVNGVVRTIRELSGIAHDRGKPLTVVTSLDEPPAARFDIKNFQPVDTFSMPEYQQQKLVAAPLLEMIEYIEHQRFSQLILSTPGPVGITGLIAGKLLGLRMVGIYHTDFPHYVARLTEDENLAALTARYMAWFYDQMETVFVPSEAYRLQLMDMGLDPAKLKILRRGVDVRKFNPVKRDTSCWPRHRLRDDRFTFVYVGRVSQEKNVDRLLEDFVTLRQTLPNVQLAIVGDGPMREKLARQYRDQNVAFTGVLTGEALCQAYASADAFVFPSTSDTFGNVVLEAMASALPSIVTDQGGPREIIDHDQTGLIVNLTESDSLTRAMHQLAGDAGLCNRLGAAARRQAARRDWLSEFDQFWNVLDPKPAHAPTPGITRVNKTAELVAH